MNKKERKKTKAIKLKNKKLLKKYPWLLPRNVWTGKPNKDYDYSHTYLDWMPSGWAKCFGLMMIDEIDKAGGIEHVYDIKEKWGMLRVDCAANQEVQHIINKYEHISEHVCIKCGKPDVYMTGAGWYFPECEVCWNKNKYLNKTPYKDVICDGDTGKIAESYTYTTYNKGEDIKVTVDISDTVERIRKKYASRKRNV